MGIKVRSEVESSHTWDLSRLYKDSAEWLADFEAASARITEIVAYTGRLAESSTVLLQAITCYLTTTRLIEKLYVYSHLRSDEDTANSEQLGKLQQVTKLYAEFAANASFLSPELLGVETSRFEELLDDECLEPYRRMLREITRYRPHTLTPKEENMLALGSEVFGTSSKIFSQLDNADFTFGTVEVNGEQKPLSHSTYISFMKNKNRAVRKTAYEQYYSVFNGHRHGISAALTGSVKKDVYLARVRNYGSALEYGLFGDQVHTSVYENLIATVSKNLSPLYKYYHLRKKVLKLKELTLYDTHVPLVPDVETHHTFEEAVAEICTSLAPLGTDYVNALSVGLTQERWVDRYENKGKRSGAYSSGCYDSPPYILMNYQDDVLNDMFTLTHEAGHSMHSYYSHKYQPYQDHEYTIFVAEVASTFNEQLLFRQLRQKYKNDPKMKAFLLNQQIDEIKGTFYRQVMFGEFEKQIHDFEEDGMPLTVDTYRECYRKLLDKYFGPALTFSDLDSLEFLRIPHFYSPFYVYKYATGIAAAVSLSERVLSGETGAQQAYLNFLKSGGSKPPLKLLADAGVDMQSSAPIEATVRLIDHLVVKLEDTLGELGLL